jgi:hypothetical protein
MQGSQLRVLELGIGTRDFRVARDVGLLRSDLLRVVAYCRKLRILEMRIVRLVEQFRWLGIGGGVAC